MFEAAELGQKVAKAEYKKQVPALRERLLEAQGRLREADFPVLVLFAGVDGAGKGETANLLNEWMDPRFIVTRAFGAPTEEEAQRPAFWRYWRDLPPKGSLGLFLSAWYHAPLLQRVYGETSAMEFDEQLDRVAAFERTLVADGALILKFWMHLSREQQERRLQDLEQDEFQKWRVSDTDWRHWRMYDKFIAVSERILMRTSLGRAPWTIVEGADSNYRSLRVGTLLLEAIERRLAEASARAQFRMQAAAAEPEPVAFTGPAEEPEPAQGGSAPVFHASMPTVLSKLDLTRKLTKSDYRRELEKYQARLNVLHRFARERKISTILVCEGWDAGGKGGAIRRIVHALDARDCEIITVAAPTDEEAAQHYLWRFWRHLSRAGRVTIFDRSWYGRVLVERVEGFASHAEWSRAYSEINDFEEQLVEHGIVLVKMWFHISPEEQERRFRSREETPYKRWKLTEEDWRNRSKWAEYEIAVNDMVQRTSTMLAPWVLVEGEDKRYARIKALKAVCGALKTVLK